MKSIFTVISKSNATIDLILVSTCLFWGSGNPIGHNLYSVILPMGHHIGFQIGRHMESTFAVIPELNVAIDLILVSTCMFLGSKNPMGTLLTTLRLKAGTCRKPPSSNPKDNKHTDVLPVTSSNKKSPVPAAGVASLTRRDFKQ